LREAARSGGDIRPANVEPVEDLPSAKGKAAGTPEFISTGNKLVALDKLLRGGLRTGSLTLIEGASGAGKSVLCQYLYYGSITSGVGTAYFSTQYTAANLVKQMQSIGLNVLDHIREDRLCVYPLQERPTGDDADSLLTELALEIQGVPPECGFIIVDGITNLAQVSQDRAVMGFFTSCQRQCEEGKTIILVARSSAFDQNLLSRLHELCNTHMNLVMETVRNKMVTTLEATKVNNAESRSDNRLSFQVEAELGVNIIPVSRVRV